MLYWMTAIMNWSTSTSTNPVPRVSNRSQIFCKGHLNKTWSLLVLCTHFEVEEMRWIDNKASGYLRRFQWIAPCESIQEDSNHKIQHTERSHDLPHRRPELWLLFWHWSMVWSTAAHFSSSVSWHWHSVWPYKNTTQQLRMLYLENYKECACDVIIPTIVVLIIELNWIVVHCHCTIGSHHLIHNNQME